MSQREELQTNRIGKNPISRNSQRSGSNRPSPGIREHPGYMKWLKLDLMKILMNFVDLLSFLSCVSSIPLRSAYWTWFWSANTTVASLFACASSWAFCHSHVNWRLFVGVCGGLEILLCLILHLLLSFALHSLLSILMSFALHLTRHG